MLMIVKQVDTNNETSIIVECILYTTQSTPIYVNVFFYYYYYKEIYHILYTSWFNK